MTSFDRTFALMSGLRSVLAPPPVVTVSEWAINTESCRGSQELNPDQCETIFSQLKRTFCFPPNAEDN
jgi:hypothetical protein